MKRRSAEQENMPAVGGSRPASARTQGAAPGPGASRDARHSAAVSSTRGAPCGTQLRPRLARARASCQGLTRVRFVCTGLGSGGAREDLRRRGRP